MSDAPFRPIPRAAIHSTAMLDRCRDAAGHEFQISIARLTQRKHRRSKPAGVVGVAERKRRVFAIAVQREKKPPWTAVNHGWKRLFLGNGVQSNTVGSVLVGTSATRPVGAGNPGDVIFDSNPTADGHPGWIFADGVGWRSHGRIESLIFRMDLVASRSEIQSRGTESAILDGDSGR